MTLKLGERLALCAGEVSEGGFVLDVGTDHAYLPCFLVGNGICCCAAASDIAEGPLCAAKRTVEQCGLAEKIALYKSDGLLDLPEEVIARATDVVIAGMGGELIARILSGRKLPEGANLILQPNTRVPFLRRFLCGAGYELRSEKAAREGKFIYTVINARYTGVCRELSETESIVGALDPRDENSRAYLEKEAFTLRAAASGMAKAASEEERREAERMLAASQDIEKYISGK